MGSLTQEMLTFYKPDLTHVLRTLGDIILIAKSNYLYYKNMADRLYNLPMEL